MRATAQIAPLALRLAGLGVTLACVAPFAAPAATLDIGAATIADVQAAFDAGLTAEKLLQAYLARIAAYDEQGPTINAVILLNPAALEEARKLDAERSAGKVRGPMHGIPVILKDNFDTFDMPTTGGSQLLEGSIPPDDAFVVNKLREAGAIIVAKVNMSEWAGGGGTFGATDPDLIAKGAVPNGSSTSGGQTRNPHDPQRGPAGSSGGTGAGIAAAFAQVGLGSDTGGSIRGPSSVNGIVGLKPTRGLMSRDGIIPLALTFDTGGPMARSVYDVAVALGTMTGVDPADAATQASAGRFATDYTQYLSTGSLRGARIGVARQFLGQDAEVDAIMEASFAKLEALGATLIDVEYPAYMMQARTPLFMQVMHSEFTHQLGDYLRTTGATYPKSFDDVVARSNDPATKYRSDGKAFGLKYVQSTVLAADDPEFVAARDQGLAAIKAAVDAVIAKHGVDAIVYPTSPRPAALIDAPPSNSRTPSLAGSATSIANMTGYPDLIVPAGVTSEGLPVTLSFFGPAWSEPKLFGYGYDFEQATKARVLPKSTPALATDVIAY